MHPDVELLNQKSLAPVNGETQVPRLADILEDIAGLLNRYITLPTKSLAVLIACWIAGTYLYQRFSYFGYLALRSPTPRCGKTKLLRCLSALVNGRPPITAQPSAAALFRTTRDVLLMDEVDKLRNSDKELYGEVIAVLNAGFEKGAVVERVEKTKGGSFEVKPFPVFGPKALAGIESLTDTLSDRSFQIQMQRASKRGPRLNMRRLEDTAARIRASLDAWARQYGDAVQDTYEDLPDELPALSAFDDRFQDIAEPLVILASLADAERQPDGSEQPNGQKPSTILDTLLEGLKTAAGQREPSYRERALLAFLEIAVTQLNGAAEMFMNSSDLVELCREREELSEIETTAKLARFLKHFELYPRSNGKQRGYGLTQAWVDEWKTRYGREPKGGS